MRTHGPSATNNITGERDAVSVVARMRRRLTRGDDDDDDNVVVVVLYPIR